MPPPANLRRRVVSGAAWITLEVAALQGLSFLLFAVLARLLAPAEFGLAAIAFVLVSSCKIVLVDGIAAIVARKAAGTALEYSTAFWLSVAVTVAAFAVLQLASLGIDAPFGTQGLGAVLRPMSLVLLAQGAARTQEVWMRRHFHYRPLALCSLAAAFAGGLAGIAAALAGLGAAALALQQVVTAGTGLALLWLACPWRPAFAFSRPAARETLGLFVGTAGGSLAHAFGYSFDTVLIGAFFGPAHAGTYNVAKRLRFALQATVATPVGGVSSPVLAEVQDDAPRFLQVVTTVTAVITAVCAPVFLGAAVVAPDLVALLFGERWAEAAPLFRWLALGGLCAVLMDANADVFLIRNRPHWTLGLALLNVALTFAAFLALRGLGPTLAAAPFVLPYLVLLPLSVALLLRATGLPPARWARAALGPLIAAALMVAALLLLAPTLADLPRAPRLALTIAAGALVYAAVAALVLRGPASEFVRLVRARRARG